MVMDEPRQGRAGVDGDDEEAGDERDDDERHQHLGREFEKAVATAGEAEREDERPDDAPDPRVDARDSRGHGRDGLHDH
jgi:hypothetical protein